MSSTRPTSRLRRACSWGSRFFSTVSVSSQSKLGWLLEAASEQQSDALLTYAAMVCVCTQLTAFTETAACDMFRCGTPSCDACRIQTILHSIASGMPKPRDS
jgi:hypothetical protein